MSLRNTIGSADFETTDFAFPQDAVAGLCADAEYFAHLLNKAFAINRPARFSPLLRSDVGDLAKPDTKIGQDFRLAQSAQAVPSSLFNLNTSQMSLIRS